MTPAKAFIFDLNGTMIDDMNYHIEAWYKVVTSLGANISQERVKQECYGKNHELLERVFPNRFSLEEKELIGYEKDKAYQEAFRPQLKLINGLEDFLKHAYEAGIKMAIGSAAIMFNIDFVLDGLNIRNFFDAIIGAEDVKVGKPHPETFLKAAEKLDKSPQECIVFEDTPKGVEAAFNAGMKTVVITTLHHREEFKGHSNIIRFGNDYKELYDLLQPHSLLKGAVS